MLKIIVLAILIAKIPKSLALPNKEFKVNTSPWYQTERPNSGNEEYVKLVSDAKNEFFPNIANTHKKGLEDITKAIQINPKGVKAYNIRGNFYAELDLHEKAIDDYTRAINIDQNYSFAYYNRALSYMALNLVQKAIDDYTKAINIEVKKEEYDNRLFLYNCYNNRGVAYAKLDSCYEAREDYTDVITIWDSNYKQECTFSTYAYYNRALCNEKIEYPNFYEKEKAIEDYTKVIHCYFDEDAYFRRGNIYFLQKEYLLALNDIEKVIYHNAKNQDAKKIKDVCLDKIKEKYFSN